MRFIKLDTGEAYDKVEYKFLREMLTKMDISYNWINVVMCYVR